MISYAPYHFLLRSLSGNTILFNGDDDGTVNRIIYEPGSPAVQQAAIPTLSEWGMIFLSPTRRQRPLGPKNPGET